MITRKLRPNEEYLASLTMSVAFEGNLDYEKAKEEALAMTEEEMEAKLHPAKVSDPPLPSDGIPSRYWATLSEDEAVAYSAMVIHTYPVRFAGETVLMGGYGGVATLPPYRKLGGVRACMSASLKELHTNGYLLAGLYPFNSGYYHQFGFEKGSLQSVWTIPLQKIRDRKTGGRVIQLLPGDSVKPLADIYNRFFADSNMSSVRREYDPNLSIAKLLQSQQYVYVWEDESGDPQGFMITNKDRQERILDCAYGWRSHKTFLFLNPRAFYGMLSFAKSAFSSDYDKIRFLTPDGLLMDALIDDAASIECKVSYNGMYRVVNTKRALSLCRCKGEGSLILQVEDGMIPENSGRYRLSFSEGKGNTVDATEEAPDATMPVSDFTALLCGVRSGAELCWMPDVTVHRPEAPFEQVFYKQKCFLYDLF